MKHSFKSLGKIRTSIFFVPIIILAISACSESPEKLKREYGWFEFVMPGLDTGMTEVDMSFLNETIAGQSGFVSVKDGHFVNGAGERIRFFGTNVTFSDCFPDKELSPKIATRMKKFGYNVVRFHHMDMRATPSGIWKENLVEFSEEQVDKLDWFIFQLKKNGIYVNLNLHVSRIYPGVDYEQEHFNFGKSLDQFYRPYIEMQKEYAKMLLTHVNPYTGTSYLEEPAVAFVEINNENSLLSNWWLMPQLKGDHRKAMEGQWKRWLNSKNEYKEELARNPDIFNIIEAYGEKSEVEKRMLWDFLMETELSYAWELINYVRNDLRSKSLITDTQASYSGVTGVIREGTYSDFIDMHSYWEHPSFPGASWSRTDWRIRNSSMVSDKNAGTLDNFGQHRIKGMPLTISEYDHPAPNFFSAEMYPMLNSVAAFQDWDGIYHFDYGIPRREGRIGGFFSETGHPLKEIFIPVGAVLFRMGAVKPGTNTVQLNLPQDAVLDLQVEFGHRLRLHRSNMDRIWEKAGAPIALTLMRPMEVVVGGETLDLTEAVNASEGVWISETGELSWDNQDSVNAVFTVNAPSAKAAVGYIGGKEIRLNEVSISMDSTELNWGSIVLVTLDGKDIKTSGKMLLVAAARAENTNMGWNEAKTSVGGEWGTSPTLAEGIPALISFDGVRDLKVVALDPAGNPGQEVETIISGGSQFVGIGAQYKTIWYLLTKE